MDIRNILLKIIILIHVQVSYSFSVRVVNVSKCKESKNELADLETEITDGHPFDQKLSGILTLPVDLDDDAILEYKSSIWDNDDEEWKVLFTGQRSVCRSLVKSLAYKNLADKTDLPSDCPITSGIYEISNFPFSGQYVVLNTIRGVDPLVKHRLRLLEDDAIVLCRVIYTLSNE